MSWLETGIGIGIGIVELVLLDALCLTEVDLPLTTILLRGGKTASGLIVTDTADELGQMVPLIL